MSTTLIEIVQDGSYRAGQPHQVLIVEGDTITFATPAGPGTVLAFAEATAKILSPTPSPRLVEIAGGSSVSYQFSAPGNASYCCQLLPENQAPGAFACPAFDGDPVLTILSSQGRDIVPATGRGQNQSGSDS